VTESFRAIVIGGGVAGASIAYHLTELGWQDVLLVDRGELTSGSTFHSAGLVGQLRSSVSLTRMMMYGAELYRRLAAETGVDPGWHEVGSLRLASSDARMQELRRQEGWAHTFGLPLEVISTKEALERFPLFDPAGVQGAAFIPTDGHLDPSNLTLALAEGARRRGAAIRTNTRVTGIDVERGRVRGIVTQEHGPIEADVVVNAGGMYANQIGHLAGVEVPVVPFAHQYVLTKPVEGGSVDLPTMRDPDRLVYFRGEAGGGLVMGGYERHPAPWAVEDGPPADFNHQLLPDDWDRFEQLAENAFALVPVLQTAEIVTMINGPEAFTPDGEFILGESDVRGFFVAAGFCAHGIAGAGGVGKVMADWIVHGEPEYDVWKMDTRRFGEQYGSRSYARDRAYEVYATYYDIHYPGEERQAGRPLKMAPTYERLGDLGAEFGEKSGWERANWFRSNEDPSLERLRPRGWAGEHWSTAIPAEHTATRERAGLFDESSFAKIEVEGPGALAYLQRLCANDVDRPTGAVVYTQMLNARGGIECDVTVSRLAQDGFMIVTGTAFGNHDLGWLRKHLPDDGSVTVRTSRPRSPASACGARGPGTS
jgi:glycine/D-amino acid oxidase-like deaminating enzyme